jgi:hypothetical protein
MRILIDFLDGESLEAESDSVNQQRLTFVVRPTSGNNRLAWVSLSAVKQITFPDAPIDPAAGGRGDTERQKVVVRFLDGKVVRAYKDETFSQEGLCFNLRLIDEQTGRLQRALVSSYAVKAIFFVDQWDSRSPGEAKPGRGVPQLTPALAQSSPRSWPR